MEKQITISIEEYNKLIDMHTKREELPEKIEVKKFTSKYWKSLPSCRTMSDSMTYQKSIAERRNSVWK